MSTNPMLFIVGGLLILSQSMLGQADYQDGYILLTEKDTLFGQIDLQSGTKLAKSCSFRPDKQHKPVNYSPGEIFGFRFIEGRYFVSREFILDGTLQNFFLEYMVDGVADLYYLKQQDKNRYFIEKDSLGITELIYEEVHHINEYGDEKIRYNTEYKGTLKYVFRDDPGIYQQIHNTGFHHRSLIDLASTYHRNTCPGEACHIFTPKPGPDISAGPRVNYSSSFLGYKTSSDLDVDGTLYLGAQVSIKPAKIRDRWKLIIICDWSKHQYAGIFSNSVGDSFGPERDYHISLEYQAISVPVMIEYQIPFQGIRPVLGAGFNSAMILGASNTLQIPNVVPYEDLPVDAFFFGFMANAGVVKELDNHLTIYAKIEYRFLQPLGIDDYFDYIRSHSAGITFGFEYALY